MITNQQCECVKKVRGVQGSLLTERQAEILTGLLLGDGHLETQNNGVTYRLKVEHSDAQADYAGWLFGEFKNLCESANVYRRIRKDGRVSVGFTTKSSDIFCSYARQFYVAQKKRIPPLLAEMLCPLGLAVWFMDDGSRKSARHKTYNIHTLGYTKPDLMFAQAVLEKRFGVQTMLHRQRNDSWRIYIAAPTAAHFKSIILSHLTPIQSMHKKLAE